MAKKMVGRPLLSLAEEVKHASSEPSQAEAVVSNEGAPLELREAESTEEKSHFPFDFRVMGQLETKLFGHLAEGSLSEAESDDSTSSSYHGPSSVGHFLTREEVEKASMRFGRQTASSIRRLSQDSPEPPLKEEKLKYDAEDQDSDHSSSGDARTVVRAKRVWRDSDDEGSDSGVHLQSHPKLRKLQKLAGKSQIQHDSDVITRRAYEERLQLFHTGRSQATSWLAGMRASAEPEGASPGDSLASQSPSRRSVPQSCLRSSSSLIDRKFMRKHTASDRLLYRGMPDGNHLRPSNCVLTSCGFVPVVEKEGCLLFTAGRDKSIHLFDLSETSHYKKCFSTFLEGTPILSATALAPQGMRSSARIVFSSPGRNLSVVDLNHGRVHLLRTLSTACPCKRFDQVAAPFAPNRLDFAVIADSGLILTSDLRTQSLNMTFKMNDAGSALAYDQRRPHRLYSGDKAGYVYEWDLRASRCVQRFQDEGSTGVTSIAAGYSGSGQAGGNSTRLVAVGSGSGYVNLYRTREDDCLEAESAGLTESLSFAADVTSVNSSDGSRSENEPFRLALLRSFGQLTAPITSIALHPTLPLMVFGTRHIRDGIRAVNTTTSTVFRNFPNAKNTGLLKYPSSVSFSLSGQLLAIGNSHGRVKILKLMDA